MTSRERVLTAAAHREPDRVPITFDCEKEVLDVLKRHFNVDSAEGVWRALNVDTRLVGADHHHPNIGKMPGNIDVNYWGVGSGQVEYSFGTMYDICYHPLAKMDSLAELDAYNWPTADEISFETIKAARAKNPDKAIIAYFCHGGYFTATEMRGMEQFLIDLAGNPEFAARIIEKIMSYIYPALERLSDEARDDFDIFYVADDFCTSSGPLVSPAMFREIIKPYLHRMARIVHARGKKMLLHTCGSVRALLPDIIDAGVDILEPIQTSAAGMEVEGLKRDFGDRLTFYGSIDLINVLSRGTPADVRNEVMKNFRVLGRGGGFIVGPGHTYIQPDTPLENILAMYETAYRECVYP
jgi:uroporphyrinogen decarboxylase